MATLESIVRLAAQACDTEYSGVYFHDRKLRAFSLSPGLTDLCYQNDISSTAEALVALDTFCVGNAPRDERVRNLPLVRGPQGIRSCASVVLLTSRGDSLGVLYVMDRRGNRVQANHVILLHEFAALAVETMETWLADRTAVAELGTLAQKYSELFDGTTDMIFAQNLRGELIAVNRAWEQAVQYSRKELLGKQVRELVVDEHKESAQQIILAQFGGGSEVRTIDFLSSSGRRISLNVTGRLLFEHGLPIGLMVFASPTTPGRENGRVAGSGTVELAMRETHRLSTTQHGELREMFADYIQTCCRVIGVEIGMVAEIGEDQARIWAVAADGGTTAEGQRVSLAGTRFAAPIVRQRPRCYTNRRPRLGRAIYETGAAGFFLVVPILVGQRAWGAMAVASREYRPEPEEPLKWFLEMAGKSLARKLLERTVFGRGSVPRRTRRGEHQALHDKVTGLEGSHAIRRRLAKAIDVAQRRQGHVVAMLIDVDRFKSHDEALGRTAGDRLLHAVGERLRECLRSGDSLGRLGADRFLCVTRRLADQAAANRLARRMLDAVRRPFRIGRLDLLLTASAGASIYPKDAEDAATLLWNTETALSQAKQSGCDTVVLFAPKRRARGNSVKGVEDALCDALERKQFLLRYQPQPRMDGGLAGLEALLTWHHPNRGRLSAQSFIREAEDSGLIVPIGAWVLGEAWRQQAAWVRRGLPPVEIAVNVSALQLAQPDFVDLVADTVSSEDLPPSLLNLEITESVLMRDIDQSSKVLAQLRELGVGISIDDFGTGYSSLSYLRRLPASALKIDRSFLDGTDSGGSALALIKTIVSLAHNLGLAVVGEGVETKDQLKLLGLAGCDRVQGHLFGLPLTTKSTERLLRLVAAGGPVPKFPKLPLDPGDVRNPRASAAHST